MTRIASKASKEAVKEIKDRVEDFACMKNVKFLKETLMPRLEKFSETVD